LRHGLTACEPHDVREALVELGNDADKLPVGLRVNVAFQQ
jgi:hypothetical protein